MKIQTKTSRKTKRLPNRDKERNIGRATPMRMCLGCRQRKAQSELVRLALNDKGRVFVDLDRVMSGRGAYVCPAEACIDKVLAKKALNRAFRNEVKIDDPQAVKDAVRSSRIIW